MRIILFLSMFVISGCNYNKIKSPGAEGSVSGQNLTNEKFMVPDFAAVNGALLVPYCVSCHSATGGNKGGLNLEGYANVRARLNQIAYRSLETRDMPPRGGLDARSMQLLQNWIDSGAKEKLDGTVEKPDPNFDRGPNNWRKIKEKIFTPKCIACHSVNADQPGSVPDGGIDLTDLAKVRAAAPAIFESVIVKGTMPIAPYPALVPRERRALLKWFDSGMPE